MTTRPTSMPPTLPRDEASLDRGDRQTLRQEFDPALVRDGSETIPPAPDDKDAAASGEGDGAYDRDEARRRQEAAREGSLDAPAPIGRAGQIPPD